MTPAGLPPWPAAPVAHGPVVLRQFTECDVPMAQELSAGAAGTCCSTPSSGTASR